MAPPKNKERATDYSRAYMAMARLAHGEAGLHIVFSRILVLSAFLFGILHLVQFPSGKTCCLWKNLAIKVS
jgi:hypothetical protein